MHPALNLFFCRPVRSRVQMLYPRPTAHWVLLLGPVQELVAAYAVPHYGEDNARPLFSGCRLSRHQPACNNPVRPISDIFVPTGDIGGWGRGKGRVGQGERSQGPEGGMRDKRRRWREERGSNRMAARRGDGEEDDGQTGQNNGGDIAQNPGPRRGKTRQRQGRVQREGQTGGESRREQGVEQRERGGSGGIRDRG